MNQFELLEARLAMLARQVTLLTQQVEHPAKLPEWFRRLAVEVHEVEQAALAAGVNPECAWCACPERRLIVRKLRASGWSIARAARALRVSETVVKRSSHEC